MKFKTNELKNISYYVKERIDIDYVNTLNYVSTENLMPYRKGKVEASALPSSKTVTRHQPGDILVSNIRPYFKKIWFSDREGGGL